MFIREKINGAGAEPSELEAIFNPCLMPTLPLILQRLGGGSSCPSPDVATHFTQWPHALVWMFLLVLSWISLSCPWKPRIRGSRLVNWMAMRAPWRQSILGQQRAKVTTHVYPLWDGYQLYYGGDNHKSWSRLSVWVTIQLVKSALTPGVFGDNTISFLYFCNT